MEQWLPVVGYEGIYEVSSYGRVKTVGRVIIRSNGHPQTIPERIRRPYSMPSGHLSVNLAGPGGSRGHLVHRLVAMAFIERVEGKPNVLHSDNDPTNNRVTNLRWGTQKENIEDSVESGTADFWGHKKNPKPNCPQDHPYSGDNLYIDPRGRRVCRTCKREWARRKYDYKEFRV